MKLSIIILKLLFLGALFIVHNNGLYIVESEDREVFGEVYLSWTEEIFNQGVELTAYVVKSEWLPVNDSYSVEDKLLN